MSTVEELNKSLDTAESELYAIKREKDDKITEARRRIEDEYAPSITAKGAEIAGLKRQLAEFAPVKVGDIIFSMGRTWANTYWKVVYVRDDESFSTVNIKKNGEEGNRYDDFHARGEGNSWEMFRRAGDPVEDIMTADELEKILKAAKVKKATFSKFTSWSESGFKIRERAKIFYVDTHVHYRDYQNTPEGTRKEIEAKILDSVFTALEAAGLNPERTQIKAEYSIVEPRMDDVISISRVKAANGGV